MVSGCSPDLEHPSPRNGGSSCDDVNGSYFTNSTTYFQKFRELSSDKFAKDQQISHTSNGPLLN